jgi:hypothetical protein
MKKKKSLMGWIAKGYCKLGWFMRGSFICLDMPVVFKKNYGKNNTKVRITIEEI